MTQEHIPRAEVMPILERIERQTAKITETVGILDERQRATREDVLEIKRDQKTSNGNLANLATEQHKMEGAIAMLRWMVAAATAGIGAGAALAGVILAVVSR